MPSDAERGLVQRAVLTLASTLGQERSAAQAAAAVDAFARLGEERAAGLTHENPPGTPLACREGCSHCCYTGQVIVTAPEVIALAVWLRAHRSNADVESLRERAAVRAERAAASEPAASPIPCPLLVGDRCHAYPVRPFVCRGCNSLDESRCRAAFRTGSAGCLVETYAPQLELWHALRAGMAAGLTALGYPRELLDLSAALHIALRQADAPERWLRKEPVFAAARRTPPAG